MLADECAMQQASEMFDVSHNHFRVEIEGQEAKTIAPSPTTAKVKGWPLPASLFDIARMVNPAGWTARSRTSYQSSARAPTTEECQGSGAVIEDSLRPVLQDLVTHSG